MAAQASSRGATSVDIPARGPRRNSVTQGPALVRRISVVQKANRKLMNYHKMKMTVFLGCRIKRMISQVQEGGNRVMV